ncbi:unnamed protein product [Allacma fusca]|uniref:Uncharacterized protein n=1 Tax=Allacma fusca TaxID=39272 RepID=A0A8J2LZZ2_9HEXA|nr:unnamed protein product [Allacma fusca]
MHVKDSNGTLPKEMEDFIADVDSFVYISFGSIIRVSKLPEETRQQDVLANPKCKGFVTQEQEIFQDNERSLIEIQRPSVISMGGMHVKESNGTLPKELEDFIGGYPSKPQIDIFWSHSPNFGKQKIFTGHERSIIKIQR